MTAQNTDLRPEGVLRHHKLQHARFVLWWLTAAEGEDVPARFRPYDIAPEPAVAEHGPVTVTVTGGPPR